MKAKGELQKAVPDSEADAPNMPKDQPKPAVEKPVAPKPIPEKKQEPARLVPKSGDPTRYVGTYQMDDPKLESINKKMIAKKKPPILFEVKIKTDGTFEFRQGTAAKFKLITGTVQAAPDKVVLSPYQVDGKVATAQGDKAVFNFILSKDGQKLLTIANTSAGKSNLSFKKVK